MSKSNRTASRLLESNITTDHAIIKIENIGVILRFRMGFVWPRPLDCRDYPDVNKGVCLTPEAILKQSN